MYQPKKIIVVTGHFGSGKTNFSTALALSLAASGQKVTVVDFDLVNPYFRTADAAELLRGAGVEPVRAQRPGDRRPRGGR